MPSSHIKFSSPAIRRCHHADVTVNGTLSTILTPPIAPSRRILVIVQNKSATDVVEVIFSDTDTQGILIQPYQSISMDYYNGTVTAKSNGTSTLVHIAYAQV